MGGVQMIKVGCYWWATTDGLRSECGVPSYVVSRIVNWPMSGSECQHCKKVMAYASNAADAAKLRADGHDTIPRHHQ